MSILLSCAHHKHEIVENDEHPFHSPLLATFSSLGVKKSDSGFAKSLRRFDVSILPKRPALPLWFWKAENAKTLVVIIPGFGSTPENLTFLTAAETFWKLGFSVLSLPSNTHPQFSRAASSKQRAGHLPLDVKEMNHALSKSLDLLKSKSSDLIPKHLILVGISYGAVQTVHWSQQHLISLPKIPFEAFVALNPPLDLNYALHYLDQKFEEGQGIFLSQNAELDPKLNHKISQLEQLNTVEMLGLFNNQELEFLLAWDFRVSLHKSLSWPNSDLRSLTFNEYVKKHLFPTYKLNEDDWRSGYNVLSRFINNPSQWPSNLLVFHTLDEFLVRNRKELLSLKRAAPEKVLLYRQGGHLGYLWSQRFENDIRNSLQIFIKN